MKDIETIARLITEDPDILNEVLPRAGKGIGEPTKQKLLKPEASRVMDPKTGKFSEPEKELSDEGPLTILSRNPIFNHLVMNDKIIRNKFLDAVEDVKDGKISENDAVKELKEEWPEAMQRLNRSK